MRRLLPLLFLLPVVLSAQFAEVLEPAGLPVLPYSSEVIATGDLDGDGRSDYLLKNTAHTTGGPLSWVPNTADGVIRMPRIIPRRGGTVLGLRGEAWRRYDTRSLSARLVGGDGQATDSSSVTYRCLTTS